MKKSVLAAALAGVMLFSGCSGVSQDEYNSLLEENSRLQAENSSILDNSNVESTSSETSFSEESSTSSEIYLQTESDNDQSEQSIAGTNDAKQDFLAKSNSLLNHYDTCKEISKDDNSDYYYALYVSSAWEELFCDAHFMFYTDDINTVCDRLAQEVQQLTEYYENYGNWYNIYVNDKDNNHILSISNWTPLLSGNKLSLRICWDNAEMQEKYKQMESYDVFKDFTINIIN